MVQTFPFSTVESEQTNAKGTTSIFFSDTHFKVAYIQENSRNTQYHARNNSLIVLPPQVMLLRLLPFR